MDLKRYQRQIAIPQIAKEGQEKICRGKVLVIGSGALGSMIAMQLAGAGVGEIGIADFDTIDISNLQRQFFFDTKDAGEKKTRILAERISALNPNVKIKSFNELISLKKARDIFGDYDFIVDGTDNPESKLIVDKVSAEKNKCCCLGGVGNFSGQVITLLPSDMRFEAYFGMAASENILPCSLGGVMGPAAALCASIQASEVLKFLSGAGKLLSGKLFTFDLLTNSFRVFQL
ncbi:MAG: HesA/MoeB/ThiF family protein [Muribaculaceae bacterium]|nr:HesA/MoeB/ThiF family protein [Muribaculaceae bacterium]